MLFLRLVVLPAELLTCHQDNSNIESQGSVAPIKILAIALPEAARASIERHLGGALDMPD